MLLFLLLFTRTLLIIWIIFVLIHQNTICISILTSVLNHCFFLTAFQKNFWSFQLKMISAEKPLFLYQKMLRCFIHIIISNVTFLWPQDNIWIFFWNANKKRMDQKFAARNIKPAIIFNTWNKKIRIQKFKISTVEHFSSCWSIIFVGDFKCVGYGLWPYCNFASVFSWRRFIE